MSIWSLEQGLAVAREVEAAVVSLGWHVALGGGVMKIGASRHDLDLIFYPHDARVVSLRHLARGLRSLGWARRHGAPFLWRQWRKRGSGDTKHVEVWQTRRGSRVDVIVPSLTEQDVERRGGWKSRPSTPRRMK